jgi:hypothetical protein
VDSDLDGLLPDRPVGLPPAAARASFTSVGCLAGGEAAAFTGANRIKSLPVFHQRIGEEYRSLFRLFPGRLEILDLIDRLDLEGKINSIS